MTSLRGILAAGAALLLVGSGAVAVAAAAQLEPPSMDPVPLGREFSVPAGLTRVACAAAPVIPEGAVAYDPDFNPIEITASSSLVAATLPRTDTAAEARLLAEPGGEPVDLEGPAAHVGALAPVTGPAVVTAEPVGGEAAIVTGGGLWRSDVGDQRGLVALPCSAASGEIWLVGGATTVGSSSLLTITNPGETAATVTVSGWSETGPVEFPSLTGVVVAPGSSEGFLLEGSDSSLQRLALRVVSDGGNVGASLLDTRIDGLTPLGADVVAASTPPAATQILPGVTLQGELDPEAGGDFVRLLNPGSSPATVTLTLLTTGGEMPIPGATGVTVDAQAVFDISLAGLPAGDHAIVVESDQPVVAGAQVARSSTSAGALERAWAPAAPITQRGSLALPGLGAEAGGARVVLANASDAEVAVVLTPFAADGSAGAGFDVTVPARGTAVVDAGELGDPVAVDVAAGAPLTSAVVLWAAAPDGTLLSVLPGQADISEAHQVVVTVTDN